MGCRWERQDTVQTAMDRELRDYRGASAQPREPLRTLFVLIQAWGCSIQRTLEWK
jgi:hypothetical protein